MTSRVEQLDVWYSRPRLCIRLAIAAALLASAASTPALAQPADQMPTELAGVGITEHLDAQLPLHAEFQDETGRTVRLNDFFDGKRPVILTLNYYRCPMLCGLQLNGLVDALKHLDWVAGEQFEIVTISFDPLEDHRLARAKKDNYISEYGRPEASRGWHFLTGDPANIKAVTETVGFGYRWNDEQNQWVHAAALFICTPTGRTSRYLYGVLYDANSVRFSLLEAAEGKIGTTMDQILLYCFHYDANARRYTLAAMKLMRGGALLVLAALAVTLLTFWRRDIHRRKAGLAQT